MLMGSLLNGQLRTPAQWEALFTEADEGFNFVGVRRFGVDRGVVEAVFGAKRMTPGSSPTAANGTSTNGTNGVTNGTSAPNGA